jgi:DnaJ-domain-containing protein 1
MNDIQTTREKRWIAAQKQAEQEAERAMKKRWIAEALRVEKEAKRAMKKRVQRAQAAAQKADAAAVPKKHLDAERAGPLGVLGCTVDSSPTEIRSAYRRLVLQWHPDKNQAAEATKMFQRIQTAWVELGSGKGDV